MKIALKVLKGSLFGGMIFGALVLGAGIGTVMTGDDIIMLNPKMAIDLLEQAKLVKDNPFNSKCVRRKARIVYNALDNQIK